MDTRSRKPHLSLSKRGVIAMNLPDNYTLPFFSYGLFQPGQIGYTGLRDFIAGRPEKEWTVKGKLRERDGLPLLLCDSAGDVEGTLIQFTLGQSENAYAAICKIEPGKLYKWVAADARRGDECERVNVLEGVKPGRGTHVPEWHTWESRSEPLFKDALDVIEEMLKDNSVSASPEDLKPLFRLQMAYLLLWTSIERYTSFRYHLGDKVKNKIDGLATDPTFAAALKDVVPWTCVASSFGALTEGKSVGGGTGGTAALAPQIPAARRIPSLSIA